MGDEFTPLLAPSPANHVLSGPARQETSRPRWAGGAPTLQPARRPVTLTPGESDTGPRVNETVTIGRPRGRAHRAAGRRVPRGWALFPLFNSAVKQGTAGRGHPPSTV